MPTERIFDVSADKHTVNPGEDLTLTADVFNGADGERHITVMFYIGDTVVATRGKGVPGLLSQDIKVTVSYDELRGDGLAGQTDTLRVEHVGNDQQAVSGSITVADPQTTPPGTDDGDDSGSDDESDDEDPTQPTDPLGWVPAIGGLTKTQTAAVGALVLFGAVALVKG